MNETVREINRTGTEIKIIDVDSMIIKNRLWHSKVIKNRVIKKGKAWSKKLRLQKVGGDKTKVRVQYRVKTGCKIFKKWSKVKNKKSSAKTCRKLTLFSTELF